MTSRTVIPHKTFSLGRVNAIAANTLLELIRLKVFYVLLLFALAIIGSSLFLVNLSFQEQFQMLKDVSLGAMSIFTWLLAVLPTAMLLPKDMEDRTLYTILAKPVPRFEYLLGKLLGILALLAIATAVMSALFLAVLAIQVHTAIADVSRGTPPDQLAEALRDVRASAFNINLLPGIVIIYVKAALCASLTLLLSTFASSWIFTVVVSIMIYFIGHLQGLARAVWLEHTGAMSVLTSGFLALVSIFFPDLQIFSLVDDVVAGTAIPAILFFKAAFLGVLYTSAYLLVAYLMFAWKEL